MPLLNKRRTSTAGREDGRVEERQCVYEEDTKSEKDQRKQYYTHQNGAQRTKYVSVKTRLLGACGTSLWSKPPLIRTRRHKMSVTVVGTVCRSESMHRDNGVSGWA